MPNDFIGIRHEWNGFKTSSAFNAPVATKLSSVFVKIASCLFRVLSAGRCTSCARLRACSLRRDYYP